MIPVVKKNSMCSSYIGSVGAVVLRAGELISARRNRLGK